LRTLAGPSLALAAVQLALAAVLLALVLPAAAHAHKPSDSYLQLRLDGADVDGRWDIALRDLDFALGLDADGDARITWGELRAREAELAAYALASLTLAADTAPCTVEPGALRVDHHSDGAYAALAFTARCPRAPAELAVGYRLFAGLDPQHRGLLQLASPSGASTAAVLGGDAPERRFAVGAPARLEALREFAAQGVWHIWLGFDHVLFLLCLLLPAVLRREAGGWVPVASLRGAAAEVARIVTAFTAAHSLTLSLAALGVVTLPARFVESAIAASVVVAAADNLRPFLPSRRWAVAFAFGLLHGIGFASALGGLGLPNGALVPALLGFNLGVELGQLALVAAFLPLAFAVRGSFAYRRLVLAGGSLAVAALALVWLVERSFGLTS
jgi:hypothetical protein